MYRQKEVIWWVQESQKGVKFNGTHHILVYANAVNLLSKYINTIKQKTEAVIDASKETDVEANTVKTNYMFISHHEEGRTEL